MYRHFFVLPACAALANGCISTVDIDAEDETRFSSIAASLPIGGNDNSWLRFQATQVDGSFEQRLDVDERIHLEDTSLYGPDLVDGDIDLAYYSIALGSGTGTDSAAAGSFHSQTHIGISRTRFDLDLEGGNRQLGASDDTIEFYVQWAALAALSERLDFGFSWALSLGREFSGISEIDLMLKYDVAEHLSITGGYRWFEYSYDLHDGDSNIEVDFRGPFLGISVPF